MSWDTNLPSELSCVAISAQSMCQEILENYTYVYGTNDFITGDTLQNRRPHSNGVLILVMCVREPATCEWFRIEFIPELISNIYVYWKSEKEYPQPPWHKSVISMADPDCFKKLKRLIRKAIQTL